MAGTTQNPTVTPNMPGAVNKMSTLDALMRMQRQLKATDSAFSRPSKEFQDIQMEINKSIKDLETTVGGYIPAEQMNRIAQNVTRYGQTYLNAKADESMTKKLSKRDMNRVRTVEEISKEMSEMSMEANRRMDEGEKDLKADRAAEKIQEQHGIVAKYQEAAKESEQILKGMSSKGVLSKEDQDAAMSCMNTMLAARLMKIAKNVCTSDELEKVGAQLMGKLEESQDISFSMPESGDDIQRFVDEKQDKAMVDSLFGRIEDEKDQEVVEKQAKAPVRSLEPEIPELQMSMI